jgi:hypothetical protein
MAKFAWVLLLLANLSMMSTAVHANYHATHAPHRTQPCKDPTSEHTRVSRFGGAKLVIIFFFCAAAVRCRLLLPLRYLYQCMRQSPAK